MPQSEYEGINAGKVLSLLLKFVILMLKCKNLSFSFSRPHCCLLIRSC